MAVNRLRNNPIIILDTNALFIPFKFKLNLDSELERLFGVYEIVIPSCVLKELEKIAQKEQHGNLALNLAQKKPKPGWYIDFERKELKKRKTDKCIYDDNPIDDEILHIAKQLNGIVLTNDKDFLKLLESYNVSTISLKSNKYLKVNLPSKQEF